MSLLLTPALSMGLYNGLIRVMRGEEATFAMIWPGTKRFFKGIGTKLLTLLYLLCWMVAPFAAGFAVFMLLPNLVGILAYFVGMIASVVLVVRALFSYEMAMYIVADDPNNGIRAAVRKSKQVMNGRRKELFFLELSFIGWLVLISWGQMMLQGLFGVVIGLTLGMFARLFVDLYLDGAKVAFYEAYVVHGVKPGQSLPEDEDHGPTLNDEE